MNFKNWFINEGKAMDVSEDMVSFAKEVVEKLNKKNWKFKETIHQRLVKSKYGEKEIKVKVYVKSKNGSEGDAVAKTGTIRLYLPGKKNPDYIPASFETGSNGLPVVKSHGSVGVDPDLPDYGADFNKYYYVVIHELVHVFDIKVASYPSWIKKYDTPDRSMQDYYTSPHEQDAWMAHRAREVLNYYLSHYKGDKSKVQKEFSKPPHLWGPWPADGDPEKTWYQHPKIWRKYINTLYNLLNK